MGNHVADLVKRYGEDEAKVPEALLDYIKAREGYDYEHHGKVGNPSTDFVPDEVIDRFCVLGPVENHIDRMVEFKDMGVDQFGVYLMHDDKEATLRAYGETVIPALKGLNDQGNFSVLRRSAGVIRGQTFTGAIAPIRQTHH